MRSDLAAMTQTGGGLPQFEHVKVAGLSAEKTTATTEARKESKSNLLIIVLLVLIVAALGVWGWFAYVKYLAR